MSDSEKQSNDGNLSEEDVRRVLERAARIDGARADVTVAELTQAAREAGISETAVRQAVNELFQDRQVVASVDPDIPVPIESAAKSPLWLRAAASGVVSAIVLIVISILIRMFAP